MIRGVTRARLKRSGKTPSERDRLTIWVMGATRMSIHSLMIKVGQRSRSHCLFGEAMINFLIWSWVSVEKLWREGGMNEGLGCALVVGFL